MFESHVSLKGCTVCVLSVLASTYLIQAANHDVQAGGPDLFKELGHSQQVKDGRKGDTSATVWLTEKWDRVELNAATRRGTWPEVGLAAL